MKRRFRRAVQGAAITSVVALAGSFALVTTATPSTAASGFSFTRIAGPDRFTTASDLAVAAFPGGAATALIATGFNFPDALAGNYLAGQDNAPILLVNVSGAVPAPTLSALQTLKTSKVIILGGTSAVGADVASELAATTSTASGGGNITVTRIAGAARDDTAQAVNTAPGAAAVGSFGGKKTAFLARDDTFPDALGAGPVAFAEHFPIILTPPTALSSQAMATISALGIQQVLILGGTAAISTGVEQAANAAGAATLARFAGTNRSDTSKQLADYAITNFGFKNSKFAVASGDQTFGGADALAAGPYAAKTDPIPLLVTNGVTDPGQVVAFGTEHAATETAGVAVGGTTPLPDATLAAITAAVTGTTGATAYTVTPTSTTNLNVAGGATKNQTYTVTGIPTGTNVDVVLYNCNNVTVAAGVATFNHSTNPGGSGNAGVQGNPGSAAITQVNGTSVTPASGLNNVSPGSGGTLTFQVTDSSAACVVPVVYDGSSSSNVLTLGTNNQPTLPYGVGGDANFFVAAPTGPVSGSPITTTSPNGFTNSAGTYTYSSSDVYQLMTGGVCTATTSATFLARISVGDTVSGTYNPPPGGPGSTFCLNDIAPAPPASVTAVPNGAAAGGVTVHWTGLGTATAPNITGYDVYRAAATPNGASFLCPSYTPPASPQTPPANGFALIGTTPTVAATAATSYTYNDTSVQPTTPTASAYCYSVSSVDGGGEIGNGSTVAGPAVPSPAVSGPPTFSSAVGTSATKTIVVTYNQPVLSASVDTDGSDFTVTTGATAGGTQTAATVASASCAGTSSTTVSIVVSTTLNAGDVATVTAKAGTDTNTVGSAATPETFQASGNSIVSSAIV